jgi:hypothetical protein
VGRKEHCANHKKHIFTLPSADGHRFNGALPLSCNRAKLDKQILETTAEFVTAKKINCCQCASSAMMEFILNLIQITSFVQANDNPILIHGTRLLNSMTEKRMAEAIRERGDVQLAETISHRHEICFPNLVVKAGTVPILKFIVCLLINRHYLLQPIVLALHENTNFWPNDYENCFVEPFSFLEGSPSVICSVIIDNIFGQSHGLDQVLDQSVVLAVKSFAQMADLVFVNTMTKAYVTQIMDVFRQVH